ncbi:Outer membrane autotransporter barrel domain-containing protein OS=Opitutaceae bacterium TAV1 GN=OpiT1DRAFT_01846 PE=4 SV=1: Autotrns_rpt [Gemmataceae bacterium]|nr:Outer membrane autotransporter barrel domain-containing protein OS=Opitutaceae bacterium TAV1 GN=OpiT1DRAFT_01846 PE=4 SV=1: Autotrns_rpt [Gemmataceae bacterium]VTU01918.1 Outer membrane autotransporter barrel domain-containing protein OS=Opitutaceae bacterium TAV1 GN=OpiT1DRAFT_01846 PE=4 SV=1: Autotrns_rpt [Gemmataceae bacterium]
MTKTGSGTATLVGDNLYSGATTVSGGTLLINGDQSAATGAVTVGSGATLGGIGTVGGAITVSSGGTLQADNGVTPGNLRVADVTIASGATLAAVIGANDTNSELVFGASSLELTTGSVLKLTSISGFDRTQSATYTLADFEGGSINLDTTPRSDGFSFGSYTHGSGPTGAVVIDPALVSGLVAGDSFSLTMTNGDLMLSFTPVPVPEPAAVLGIAVAALGVGGFVRRRFRKSPEPTSAA